MQDVAFVEESKIEQDHWWFVVRREMFAKYLKAVPKDAAILDIGVGAGSNLRMLKEAGFTNYQGFDFSPLAKKFCEEKNLGVVQVGDICDSDLADNSYDVILFTDVVEHIENDSRALKEVARILKPKDPKTQRPKDPVISHCVKGSRRTFSWNITTRIFIFRITKKETHKILVKIW